MTAKGIARVELAVQREVQMVLVHEVLQVLRAQELLLPAQSICKIKAVDAQRMTPMRAMASRRARAHTAPSASTATTLWR